MKLNHTTTDTLVDLAEAIELGDPIDWGMLSVNEHDAYQLIAAGVLESYRDADVENRELILLATAVKLTVENFVLNLRLQEAAQSR